MNPALKYAVTQKETASPQRLMVMLFEAALRDIRAGAGAFEEGRDRDAVYLLTHASDIVVELLSALDESHAPQLVETLRELYQFVTQRLLQAVSHKQAAYAREAERVFAPLVDAFSEACVAAAATGASVEASP